jgi:hypothetical protein
MREILQFICNSMSLLTVTCYGQTYEFLNYMMTSALMVYKHPKTDFMEPGYF